MRQLRLELEGHVVPSFYVTPAKVPFAGSHGHLDATSNPDELAKLAERFRGPKLIAIATGAISGIDILDIDPRHGGDRWFFEHRDQLLKTRVHETRSGGWHIIFKHSPSLRSNPRVASGVEFLSTGRLAVWWPAHAGRVLCEGPVAALPAWLLELLPRSATTATTSIEKRGDGPQMSGVMGQANRIPKPLYFEVLRLVPLSATVTRHHQRRVIGILSTVATRCEYRNNALNVAAFCFRDLIPPVTRSVAESLLLGAAEVCGYAAKDGNAATMATIRSGLGPDIGGPGCVLEECHE